MTIIRKLVLLLIPAFYDLTNSAPEVYNEPRLIRSAPYEPFDLLTLTTATLECIVHLGVPPERIRLYQAGIFPNEPATWCLVRCVALKLGVYGDQYGPKVGNLYTQFGADRSEARFRELGLGCTERMLARYNGTCEKAYHSLMGCFGVSIRQFVKGDAQLRGDSCTKCYQLFDELYLASMSRDKCQCTDNSIEEDNLN